jgi:hypothetical protein
MVFEHLALIGCGLMGGSFALAAKEAGLVQRVTGYSRSAHSAQRAQALGVVDTVATTAEQCVQGADLVLLAVPVASTEATLRSLLPGLAPHALVMDVGSTKQDVVLAAQAALGERMAQFVPAHPICGKEVAGIEHADGKLYQHQQVILTPLACHSTATVAPGQTKSGKPLGMPGAGAAACAARPGPGGGEPLSAHDGLCLDAQPDGPARRRAVFGHGRARLQRQHAHCGRRCRPLVRRAAGQQRARCWPKPKACASLWPSLKACCSAKTALPCAS